MAVFGNAASQANNDGPSGTVVLKMAVFINGMVAPTRNGI